MQVKQVPFSWSLETLAILEWPIVREFGVGGIAHKGWCWAWYKSVITQDTLSSMWKILFKTPQEFFPCTER
jgi:hypothetical protein